ncbi:ETC complex I subunit conserved region-domain-containing protein [Trichophaea hybrida]|nr:ETC complex I subunit conserved region-domain-containing protein [Trichophaea hybrida]
MRASLRLLTARLPPFTPTGITGLLTHPHPRPTLIALYNHTLNVLSTLPPHSVYRQSAENLTKQRLEIVKAVKPQGWEAFLQERKAASLPEETDIRDMGVFMRDTLNNLHANSDYEGHKTYTKTEMQNWESILRPNQVKELLPNQTEDQAKALEEESDREIILEPQLSAEQVEEIEGKIGEGLIEEVIEEGWGELRCAETMKDHKVWEPLEVVPDEDQWAAFERTPPAGASQA